MGSERDPRGALGPANSSGSPTHPSRLFGPWWRFSLACAVVFLLRGIFVLSVLPPFEGWDEYQHLAYVVFVGENHRPPRQGLDTVPESLLEKLSAYPHPRFAATQLKPLGATDYQQYWSEGTREPKPPGDARIHLYQAQHPPLFYLLAAPIFQLAGGVSHLLGAITAVRLVNLLFGAAAVFIVVHGLGTLIPAKRTAMLASLLVAWNPSFLLNCARVANDAGAVCLSTFATVLLLGPSVRRAALRALAGGILLGLAAMTKVTAVVLLPFAVAAVAAMAVRSRARALRLLAAEALLLVGFLLPTGAYFSRSLAGTGSLVPLQELTTPAAVPTAVTLVGVISQIDWARQLARWVFRDFLWVGGWSYLQAPVPLYLLWGGLLLLALAGWAVPARWFSPRGERAPNVGATPWLLLVACVGAFAGLALHAAAAMRAWGYVSTNGWYAAVVLSWLLVLAAWGASRNPLRWARIALPIGLLGVFVVTELYGTLAVMIPHYTGHVGVLTAFERLTVMHPASLGPVSLILSPVLSLVLTIAMTVAAVGTGSDLRYQGAQPVHG